MIAFQLKEVDKGLIPDRIIQEIISKLPKEQVEKANYFNQLFDQASQILSDEGIDENIKIERALIKNDLRSQVWEVALKGEENTEYQDKKIQGYLILPNDYPKAAPKFYFWFFKDNQKIIHENIYGDGLLCMPMVTNNWKGNEGLTQVLTTIRDIFNHPNIKDPANPIFTQAIPAEKTRRRKAQSELLEDWE
ncbi:unnamed protein product [Paramecium sonneborni]|uniref:UBC core domain-containing protein n=1 Tax=Paramecium sonneborni TaxID=65129 RepID=A0A8S1NSR2_9CILI|nr:unnamed protein product [Paramecium sonneborni]